MTQYVVPSDARAAVLGHPVGHSRSPLLHAAAYKELNVPIDYTAIDILPEQAADFAQRLRTEPGWVGVSVTMPMKDALIPYIDEPSERVKRLGALNTIMVHHSSTGVRLAAENTDIDGIVRALALPRPTPGEPGPLLGILGNGNTALAALEACALLGASRVELLVRNPQRATEVIALAQTLGLVLNVLPYTEGAPVLTHCDALISTLPPRAADTWLDPLGLPAASTPRSSAAAMTSIKPGAILLDVAYDPWPSALATAWETAGGSVVSGLSMLVHQGLEQVKLFSRIQDADWEHVTNVMCDAVGVPRPSSGS
ncbi:shikimate dehydrogenase [Arthrobacter sp. MYb227]|uniref:shikimate dehydrogenase family protein n=1 Tax=Arthrobacter sp. MYb227 TaxID=1848601 RepID=UPI000CFD9E64|nr:shikimate dehydrogenase [Arthrobacter sp. MYb227]PQZ93806.1 shikimate dehydrogenase [Arthrobacter sp. MYb227]